jgi:endoglucanase
MKKFLLLLAAGLWMLAFSIQAQDAPFHRGVNVTEWLQGGNVKAIKQNLYTEKDFQQIKSLGCDVVRLPINLHSMTSGKPDYKIDPAFFQLLDKVVGWAEKTGMYLIIDNHTFDPAINTEAKIGPVLLKVWSQMAAHYKNGSKYIIYEILNEPHGITDQQWNPIQGQVISKIRESDTTHYIMVGGAGWNSYNNLEAIPAYNDKKLIYTFHFYDPFVFTHQGASWTNPSMVPLKGVPFPFKADAMPELPASLKGSWIGSGFNNYLNTGNMDYVKSLLDIAVRFKNERHVPLFCGEYGVYIPNSPAADRVVWYEGVRKYLEENGISWTTWDYHGGFGLFKTENGGSFEKDLNIPLVKALGFNVPAGY